MNKLIIIGNVSNDPVSRTTPAGKTVCSFNVAVNNKYKPDAPAQFFRVAAWNKLGENCQKFLQKGSKVCVTGAVRLNQYTRTDGQSGASLEVDADDVEFLSTKQSQGTYQSQDFAPSMDSAPSPAYTEPPRQQTFTDVTASVEDDLPF